MSSVVDDCSALGSLVEENEYFVQSHIDQYVPVNDHQSHRTQWLSDQSNPIVKEKTHAKVRDVGGITDIELKDLDNGESHSPDISGSPTSVEFEHEFETSVLTASIGSVELELSAEDVVGNEVQVEEEVKGAIDTVLDALGQIWDAIAGVLSEVAEAVKGAVDVVWQFVQGVIESALNLVLDPILNAIDNYVDKVDEALQNYLNENGTANEVANALSGGMLDKIKALTGKIMWVQNYVKALLDAIEGGMKRVMNFVVGVIGSALRAAGGDKYADMIEETVGASSIFSAVMVSILSAVLSTDLSEYTNSRNPTNNKKLTTILNNGMNKETFLNILGGLLEVINLVWAIYLKHLHSLKKEIASIITAMISLILTAATGDALWAESFAVGFALSSVIFAAEGIVENPGVEDIVTGLISIFSCSVALADIYNHFRKIMGWES